MLGAPISSMLAAPGEEVPNTPSKPRTPPCLHRPRPVGAGGVRAARLRGARTTPLDPAPGSDGPGRRGAADRRYRRTGAAIRPLRLPQDRRAPVPGWMGDQPQAGRTHLAA